MAEVSSKLKDCIEITDGRLEIKDKNTIRGLIDDLIYEAVFNEDEEKRKTLQGLIIEIAKKMGAVPSSIQSLYEEMGKTYPGFTVPAINIRGLTYDTAKSSGKRLKKTSARSYLKLPAQRLGIQSRDPSSMPLPFLPLL
jgi:hypothetical protein